MFEDFKSHRYNRKRLSRCRFKLYKKHTQYITFNIIDILTQPVRFNRHFLSVNVESNK